MPYSDVAQAHADNVRALFTPPAAKQPERGMAGSTFSASELADQAERLAPISSQLTVEAANKLAAQNLSERVEASNQLLAKALTDLTISAHLFEAAEDAEVQTRSDRIARSERSISGAPGTLMLACAYIAIMAYVVLNGADYLDADRLTLLNRVRGIRQVIETNLTSA